MLKRYNERQKQKQRFIIAWIMIGTILLVSVGLAIVSWHRKTTQGQVYEIQCSEGTLRYTGVKEVDDPEAVCNSVYGNK